MADFEIILWEMDLEEGGVAMKARMVILCSTQLYLFGKKLTKNTHNIFIGLIMFTLKMHVMFWPQSPYQEMVL